jgi:23S rRNA (uracil1939-C5)-methyltransferase
VSAPRGLSPGDVVEVTVEKGVYRGLGLARHEGQVVFVARAFPNDRLRVRVESARPGYVEGRSESLLAPSAERRPSPCPYVPRCGGCAYQELDYGAQLRLKAAVLRESLQRAGVPWAGELFARGSPEEGWRLRASLHVAQKDGRVLLGLHEEGSHRVVDVERCLQLSTRTSSVARRLAAALQARPEGARGVRGLDLAESPEGDELVAVFETELGAGPITRLAALGDAAPELTGLGALTGLPRRFVTLRGDPHVNASVRGLRLRAHAQSFFQANRFLVEDLVDVVLGLLEPGRPVLDLYAGVGLFALPLAGRAPRVQAVESNPTAVEDAEENARRAGTDNLRVLRGEVEAVLARLPADAGEAIVLDPPRTGAGNAVVALIAGRRPDAIVYVSCDPPTLGRDLAAFARRGYVPDTIQAFDMFPDTYHLETVVRLVPRRDV